MNGVSAIANFQTFEEYLGEKKGKCYRGILEEPLKETKMLLIETIKMTKLYLFALEHRK
jgi:hypothetical protein